MSTLSERISGHVSVPLAFAAGNYRLSHHDTRFVCTRYA